MFYFKNIFIFFLKIILSFIVILFIFVLVKELFRINLGILLLLWIFYFYKSSKKLFINIKNYRKLTNVAER